MNSRKHTLTSRGTRGISLIETVVVLTIVLIIGAVSIPRFLQTLYNIRLRSSTASVADLVQRARMAAARANSVYPIRYRTTSNLQEVYIDVNNNASWESSEPIITLPEHIVAASGAPNGASGSPSNYTLVGDTTSGTPFDNTNLLAFSPRGLPCNYITSTSTCGTPAASYFVYYMRDNRNNVGWSAVLVTKSGRSKVLMWNGASWR